MFLERLSRVANRIEGAGALVLVGRDGIPVEMVTVVDDLDLETLGAESLAHVQQINSDHEEFAVGTVRQLTLVTKRYALLVSQLVPEYYLLLVMKRGGCLGRARFELRRATLSFESELVI